MEKILSIIIPTYNMEKYLRYCLNSLLIKDGLEKLEILVVNDGSTDSSLAIALEYETRYPEVFKAIDKRNGNYGSCINKGLEVATGKYVKILDADDSFETEHFEEFVKYLTVVDADLVLSDFVIVDENRNITSLRRYGFPVGLKIEMDDVCSTDAFVDMQMHAVTYKRENLTSLGYRQCEGISYTDQQWIFIPMIKVRTVYNFDKYVYKYLVGRIGQTMDTKVRLRSINHLMKCMLSMTDDYNNYSCQISPFIRSYLHARIIPQIKDIYITSFANYSDQIKLQLLEFDRSIKSRSALIYHMTEKTSTSFNYIDFWRKHVNIPCFIIRWLVNMYLQIRK